MTTEQRFDLCEKLYRRTNKSVAVYATRTEIAKLKVLANHSGLSYADAPAGSESSAAFIFLAVGVETGFRLPKCAAMVVLHAPVIVPQLTARMNYVGHLGRPVYVDDDLYQVRQLFIASREAGFIDSDPRLLSSIDGQGSSWFVVYRDCDESGFLSEFRMHTFDLADASEAEVREMFADDHPRAVIVVLVYGKNRQPLQGGGMIDDTESVKSEGASRGP